MEWEEKKKSGHPRTHHREKTDLSQNRAWNHLFPRSVLEDRSKKVRLGSSSKPMRRPQILKQKEEASHLAISSGQELVQMS
jgi:hypothetical protein